MSALTSLVPTFVNKVKALPYNKLITKRMLPITVSAAIMLISGTVWAVQATSAAEPQKVATTKTSAQQQKTETKTDVKAAEAATAPQEATTTPATATTPAASTAKPTAKAAAPAKAAPAAAQPDVNIVITRPGQVAPGTVITSIAKSNVKRIYGGDLVAGSVNFSKSAGGSLNVTVSTPDGSVVTTPTRPWNEPAGAVGIGMDPSQYKTSGNSFTMIVDNGPVGSYRIHVEALRDVGGVTYQYDGFITVNILP